MLFLTSLGKQFNSTLVDAHLSWYQQSATIVIRGVPMESKAKARPSAAGSISEQKIHYKSIKVADDFASDGAKDHDISSLPSRDYQLAACLTLLAAIVRLFRLYQPSSVVFDEVHFGGFASKYIKGTFFMDVHPPLAKLLITLAGWLAGFDGQFDFKEIGKDYVAPGVPYVAMRMFPALCGILLVPVMFFTLKASGCRTSSAAMGSCLIIFENGLLTQARLILLDAPLMIATAFTVLAFTCFSNQHELGLQQSFSPRWWFWLAMTGLGLGATASIKWVGLFTIAWVGCLTILQLWVLLGSPKTVPMHLWIKHVMARAFCLIAVPVLFYMTMFAIHFALLRHPGEGNGFMSSEFQATLTNKGMSDVAADVLMGSRVSIRHVNTQGGYLHSHPLMYPTGSQQQQITLYPHKDDNNVWLIENQTQPIDSVGNQINGTGAWDSLPEPMFVRNHDIIRLYHMQTHRRLHSHDVRPPVTEADWQNEVTAYGYQGFDGDANDYFRIEIVPHKSAGAIAQERLRTIHTKFQLVHVMTGCVLFSHKVKLPAWASEQQEVTCAKGGTLPNSLWYIESNESPHLGGDSEKVNYSKPGFLQKFWELQKVMWTTNAGLTESHAWDSRPPSWPILRRGINFWGQQYHQVYLMGNPLIWWSSTAAVVIYVFFKAIAILRWQRSCQDYSNINFKRFDYEVGMSVLGWALHYFPFYLMSRQLFIHHYFPALYFAIIALCQCFDFIMARVYATGPTTRSALRRGSAVGVVALSIVLFYMFSPLAYGTQWTKSECNRVKLFETWDFDCNTFPSEYTAYANISSASPNVHSILPTNDLNAGLKAVSAVSEKGNSFTNSAHTEGDEVIHSQEEESNPQNVIKREERIEFRDQDGNILDPQVAKALEGKVEFKTRYETKTRVLLAESDQ